MLVEQVPEDDKTYSFMYNTTAPNHTPFRDYDVFSYAFCIVKAQTVAPRAGS